MITCRNCIHTHTRALFFTLNFILTCIVYPLGDDGRAAVQTHKFMHNIPCSRHVFFIHVLRIFNIHSFVFSFSFTVQKNRWMLRSHLCIWHCKDNLFFHSRIDTVVHVLCIRSLHPMGFIIWRIEKWHEAEQFISYVCDVSRFNSYSILLKNYNFFVFYKVHVTERDARFHLLNSMWNCFYYACTRLC